MYNTCTTHCGIPGAWLALDGRSLGLGSDGLGPGWKDQGYQYVTWGTCLLRSGAKRTCDFRELLVIVEVALCCS